jgi:hypothetical protein
VASVATEAVSEEVSEEEVAVVAVEVSHLEVEEADSGDHDDSTQYCISPGARRVALV